MDSFLNAVRSLAEIRISGLLAAVITFATLSPNALAQLMAGAAKTEITDRQAGPVNDPSYAKALVLRDGATTAVIVTVDAVAIGGIGRIGDTFLANVRRQLAADPGVAPHNVIVNASHCHSIVRMDTEALTVQTIRAAWRALAPARAGGGEGWEERISENRRLAMKDGSEVDMRRAYALAGDEEVAAVGPIDPQIGILRIDRADGRPLAVLYNFACHPIMNPPRMGNSADFPGFASKVVEDSLGGGAIAFFVQGCAGDINPVRYKTVMHPPSAEALGNLLGLAVLRACRQIETKPGAMLRVASDDVALPRATDFARRLAALEAEQARLVEGLKPTDINFKTFLPLFVQHKLSPDFPSYYAQGYLHDRALGREDLAQLDATNRESLEAYLHNIATMERLTRLNTNAALLRMHQAQTVAAGRPTVDTELTGIRIGDFTLVTFPGELTVTIGLGIKKRAPLPHTFVAGCTNGYLYYLPTAPQRANLGFAQEDCDCLVAPEWQPLFEARVDALLRELAAP